MLSARRTALAARVQLERARLAEVEARIAEIERDGHAPRYEVAIRSVEPATAVSLRRRFFFFLTHVRAWRRRRLAALSTS